MKNILLSKKLWVSAALIAAFYLFIVICFMNPQLLRDTFFGDYPLSYKVNLIAALYLGIATSRTTIDFILLLINAILVGVGFFLIGERIRQLHSLAQKSWLSLIGGTLGMVGTGCAACSLSLISLLGVTSGWTLIFFENNLLSFIALVLLAYSVYTLQRDINKSISCEIK